MNYKENKWSYNQIELLKKHRSQGMTAKEIAPLLRKTPAAITLKTTRLKIPKIILCLDCKIKIETFGVGQGNRLRCPACSEKEKRKKRRAYDMTDKICAARQKRKDFERFGGNREKALERDLYTCQKCGVTHHQKKLEVHHIDKQGRNKKEQNHALNNLLVVCTSCHMRIHKKDIMSKRWPKSEAL